MNLVNVLKGCRIVYDGVQSIQGLTIIPLTCDSRFSFNERYAAPDEHGVKTTEYGTVVLENPHSRKMVLVPPHTTYITKGYRAQDHTISKGVVVPPSGKVTLRDSRCVESTQAGFIRSGEDNIMRIAPLALREVAYNYAGVTDYRKLWGSLQRFNQSTGAGSKAQIKDYFVRWDKDLTQFIAHFERIDNCIGFMTLYEDEVVAIDKFPSFAYTSQIWDRLVRDSYAALVVSAKLANASPASNLPKIRAIGKNTSIKAMYESVVEGRVRHYKRLLEEMVDITFDVKDDSSTSGSSILSSEGYIGQVISQDGFNVMVSIIKKDKFNPTELRKARAIRALAAEQNLFSVQ